MREVEWLACADPRPMLDSLRGKASERKLRLFTVACCRRAWGPMRDETCRRAVEVAERYADRQASNQEREQVTRAVAALCDHRVNDSFYLAYHVVRGTRYTFVMATIAAEHANWIVTGSPGSEGPATEAERVAQCCLLRDIYGNPVRLAGVNPAWRTADVARLAQAAYDQRELPAGTLDVARLVVLADALEDAGGTDQTILDHLRGPGPHVRGCRALDLLLGKE
jgi:hypothetical protein